MSDSSKKQWQTKRGPQPVADLVSKLLNPVIERRAGMTTDLVASWEEIVGEHHGTKSRPEKLNWPRQASDDDPFEPATLVIACEGGHALFLQHDSTTLIERVNTYFGFNAVARIKLVQKPLAKRDQARKLAKSNLPEQKKLDLEALLEDVSDPTLKAALERLGRGVFSKHSGDKD